MIFGHLISTILKALCGSIIWRLVYFLNPQSECFFVLYNTKDNEQVTKIALSRCKEYMKEKQLQKVIIIYSKSFEPLKISNDMKSISLSRFALNALIDYYSLCGISNHIVICDLSHVKGRDGIELVGVRGITLEQIINAGLLDL